MSWSRTYSGSVEDVAAKFAAEVDEISTGLPAFERADVSHALEATTHVLAGIPAGASVNLLVSGHGWRDTTGKGGGALAVAMNYALNPSPSDGSQSL